MSLSYVMHCDSDLGFLNYLIMEVLICTSVLGTAEVYFIYHVKVHSLSVVTNCTSLILSSWIPLMVRTASHRNQCCSGSSTTTTFRPEIRRPSCRIFDTSLSHVRHFGFFISVGNFSSVIRHVINHRLSDTYVTIG